MGLFIYKRWTGKEEDVVYLRYYINERIEKVTELGQDNWSLGQNCIMWHPVYKAEVIATESHSIQQRNG
jgi:hypothetical protein